MRYNVVCAGGEILKIFWGGGIARLHPYWEGDNPRYPTPLDELKIFGYAPGCTRRPATSVSASLRGFRNTYCFVDVIEFSPHDQMSRIVSDQ